MNGGHLALAIVATVALIAAGVLYNALTNERADHAATRYELGAAWSAYTAIRALHEEADLGIVELDWPPAVAEWRELRLVEGGRS